MADLYCFQCKEPFTGRKGTVYCGSSCRQKSYRARRKRAEEVMDAAEQAEDTDLLTLRERIEQGSIPGKTFDAVDHKALQLLKDDPEAYFADRKPAPWRKYDEEHDDVDPFASVDTVDDPFDQPLTLKDKALSVAVVVICALALVVSAWVVLSLTIGAP